MKERRWLVPFTHGVDLYTIGIIVRLAEIQKATLVPVSLIPVSPGQNVRLERIMQSKDFLETVRWRASRYRVTVEPHEFVTSEILQSLKLLTQELCCHSMVVVTGEQDVLLDNQYIRALLIQPPAQLVLVRLPMHQRRTLHAFMLDKLLQWVHKDRGSQSVVVPHESGT